MKVNIYTIYDKVAEECGPVFQAKNDNVACRMVKSLFDENPSILGGEYEVYSLGLFDTENRNFVPESDFGRLVISDLMEVED